MLRCETRACQAYNKNQYHNMSSEFITNLINHQALVMDQQLQQEHPELEISTFPLSPSLSYAQSEWANETDVFDQSISDELSQSESCSQTLQNECSCMMKHSQFNKTKLIKKQNRNQNKSSNTQESFESASDKKKGRKGQVSKKPTYPTKNFLPNFKRAHLDFLINQLGEKVKEHPFIIYLKSKLGISLEDYTKLYNFQEFRDTFALMFRQKYLYRMLLLSRSQPTTKKIHHRKLFLFNKAFQVKIFSKIN